MKSDVQWALNERRWFSTTNGQPLSSLLHWPKFLCQSSLTCSCTKLLWSFWPAPFFPCLFLFRDKIYHIWSVQSLRIERSQYGNFQNLSLYLLTWAPSHTVGILRLAYQSIFLVQSRSSKCSIVLSWVACRGDFLARDKPHTVYLVYTKLKISWQWITDTNSFWIKICDLWFYGNWCLISDAGPRLSRCRQVTSEIGGNCCTLSFPPSTKELQWVFKDFGQ